MMRVLLDRQERSHQRHWLQALARACKARQGAKLQSAMLLESWRWVFRPDQWVVEGLVHAPKDSCFRVGWRASGQLGLTSGRLDRRKSSTVVVCMIRTRPFVELVIRMWEGVHEQRHGPMRGACVARVCRCTSHHHNKLITSIWRYIVQLWMVWMVCRTNQSSVCGIQLCCVVL